MRLWWNRFGPLFAADIRRQRVKLRQSETSCDWTDSPASDPVNSSQPDLAGLCRAGFAVIRRQNRQMRYRISGI